LDSVGPFVEVTESGSVKEARLLAMAASERVPSIVMGLSAFLRKSNSGTCVAVHPNKNAMLMQRRAQKWFDFI
jgi:hypothetical protein